MCHVKLGDEETIGFQQMLQMQLLMWIRDFQALLHKIPREVHYATHLLVNGVCLRKKVLVRLILYWLKILGLVLSY